MPTPQELAAMLQQARPALPTAPTAPVANLPTAGAMTAAQKEMERRQGLRESAKAAYGMTDAEYDAMLAQINAKR